MLQGTYSLACEGAVTFHREMPQPARQASIQTALTFAFAPGLQIVVPNLLEESAKSAKSKF